MKCGKQERRECMKYDKRDLQYTKMHVLKQMNY